MATQDQFQREFECTIKRLDAMNFVLTKTREALARYDPSRNAAELRDDSQEDA